MEAFNLCLYAALCSALFIIDFINNRGTFIADGKVRIMACLAALSVMVLDYFISGRSLPVMDFGACLALGDSFLLTHPSSFEPVRKPLVCIFAGQTLALISVSPFVSILGAVPRSVVLSFVSILLIAVNIVLWATDRFSALNLLIRRTGGMHSVADAEKLVHSQILSLLVALLLASGHMPEKWALWVGECVALLLLVLMSVRYYLYCTGKVVLFRRRTSKVERALSDSVTASPGCTGESGLSMEAMYVKILEYMEAHRPYLDEKFSLADMAAAIGTNKAYVSRTVNTMYGNNFCQFVNYYRIQYAADMMRKDRRLKVLEVSMMSGFHSVASFNMAFKLYMNDLPSEFTRNFHSKSLSIPVEPGQ